MVTEEGIMNSIISVKSDDWHWNARSVYHQQNLSAHIYKRFPSYRVARSSDRSENHFSNYNN